MGRSRHSESVNGYRTRFRSLLTGANGVNRTLSSAASSCGGHTDYLLALPRSGAPGLLGSMWSSIWIQQYVVFEPMVDELGFVVDSILDNSSFNKGMGLATHDIIRKVVPFSVIGAVQSSV